MSTQSDLQLIQNIMDGLNKNPVARFSYTKEAFDENNVNGVDVFDRDAGQNIPATDKVDYNPSIIDRGVRTQGASIPRMGWNHYIGRLSYNVNKLIQKIFDFFISHRASLAHNANEYDSSAQYKTGDICYTVRVIDKVKVYSWHYRISISPETIQDIPPDVALHWAVMQESSSFDSQLPYSAPGYKHKFTIVDLTNSDAAYYYPCVTTPLVAGLDSNNGQDTVTIPLQVLTEVFTKTGTHRASLSVQSIFTGFSESSKDILFGKDYIQLSDGKQLPFQDSPIGYTKLPKGCHAVIWLKGGQKYALWNSFGAKYELYTSMWANIYSEEVEPVGTKPFTINHATISARLQTPFAVNLDEAPNLSQVIGSIPLPIELKGSESFRSLRKPGKYIALTNGIGNTLTDGPPQESPLGACDITIKGDKDGLALTIQEVMPRITGNEYTRVLMGENIVVDWYKSKSATGWDVSGGGNGGGGTGNGEGTYIPTAEHITKFDPTARLRSGGYAFEPEHVVRKRELNLRVTTLQLYSKESLLVSNARQILRRQRGWDLGIPYLSEFGEVYHFDTDVLNQNQQSDISIEGDEIHLVGKNNLLDGIPLTPVITGIPPHEVISKSLLGNFKITKTISASENSTVEFWTRLPNVNNRILFRIGTPTDTIILNVFMDITDPEYSASLPGDPEYSLPNVGDIPYSAALSIGSMLEHRMPNGIEYFVITNIIEKEWLHFAVVNKKSTISVFIADMRFDFTKYSVTDQIVTAVINEAATNFNIDELYIDSAAALDFSTFAENTEIRIPYANLNYREKWLILEAEDINKVKTNLFETQAFKTAVQAVISNL